ncbi:bifunctional phosphopantothenoylcysteine decarboxylase/phosphopantothenate synthase [Croceibacterium sp. LX-88]|jgi:phosphopantothenoylcysteine decarboxylase/phosphopantothenate--cysteine ligase|uniref:Coenzyme A biosynthesis bifunctional protein CoaBC n=1 Tax=Croceibacterium selenioxidans TaxID=2838833 RepID=A0ABS5W7L7_9SPHN|nr:phosphopantothenoylcysteine decarboxylase [Croceibacterium selenioxidans]MBT2135694.1 bifunctional phosphopantothenoylcysteine decarboxylase/phosphopantothenate synthase [Croceibacterium selenioxidans]
MAQPRILLVVGGGIAAYKSCELVRLIKKGGGDVTCVLTEGGAQFVTPMSLAALSGNQVHSTLWDLKDEVEIGHIQLSRQADLVVVCPATADLLAKMAAGIADDLGTTLILATDKPVMAVPAMNVRMWEHEATQRNVTWLKQAGVHVMQPDEGEMACGEYGPGRLPEPEMIWLEIAEKLGLDPGEAGSREVASYLEALEPEDEPESELGAQDGKPGGLAGLLASLIPRSTPRRIEPDEVRYVEEPFADAPLDELMPEGPPLPTPDLTAGPLIVKKGQARSAPPTDPAALNHHVNDRQAPPEPPAFDPLDGQPDFDVDPEHRPLFGKHILVTAGPTHEPIDPVRFIANRSSGKQGFAIAAAAAAAGARVTLVAGPVALATPPGVDRVDVESAQEMAAAVKAALPADAAVMVAAVADWRTKDFAQEKIKKRGSAPPALILAENPDILASVAGSRQRPKLLVGFAAETENVVDNATRKRKSKGVDWIVANDVGQADGKGGVMGGDENTVHLISEGKVEDWEPMSKQAVARRLVERMTEVLTSE